MRRITHIITGLNIGGAETMLYRLLSSMDSKEFSFEVISLTDIGLIGKKIQKLGIPVRALGMRSGVPNPISLFRLAYWLRKSSPDIIQTWMYHADFMGGLAAKLSGISAPVIWGIRQTKLVPSMKRSTRFIARISAYLSYVIPKRIISCAKAAKSAHVALGYNEEKIVVIPNGIDLNIFKPDNSARNFVRSELGISHKTLLIGLIARFEPQKDQETFIKAAGFFNRSPNINFILCGRDIHWQNKLLIKWIKEADIERRVHLLGNRDDIPNIVASLDIATLSSYQEGFPNVVLEAMACGVPCVVTDVGDASLIVGDTGIVVRPRNPKELAEGWEHILNMSAKQRSSLGMEARKRIQENYSIERIVEKYKDFYKQIL